MKASLSVLASIAGLPCIAIAQCPTWLSGPGTATSLQGSTIATLLWDPPGAEPEQLIAGGTITTAGSIAVTNIARYDPVSGWRAMGPGLPGAVRALTIHKSELYAAGDFGVSRWTGSSWTAIGSPGATDAILSYNGSLLAGGGFGVMSWNGSTWSAFAGNVSGNFPVISNPGRRVYALADFGGDLIVGGHFAAAGGVPANCIARWNGSTWSPLGGGGIFVPSTGGVIRATVRAFDVDGSKLYIGGTFEGSTLTPGANLSIHVTSANVIAWNGSAFEGLSGPCNSRWHEFTDVEVIDGDLWVGGTVPFGCGGTQAYFGTRSAAGVWSLPGPDPSVQNIIKYAGFPLFDGRTSWQNGAKVELTSGVTPIVRAFVTGGGSLYAAGPSSAGAQFAGGVARWDGAWHSIGLTGVSGAFVGVTDLAWYNDELYIGGDFTSAAGLASGGLIRYNGTSFNTVGGSVNGPVYAMEVYNGTLIVSGPINGFGALPAANIAAWNGTAWSTVGSGLSAPAHAFTLHNGDLYASGAFVPGNNVAKFNGTSWSLVPGGFDAYPTSLASHAGKLYASGPFSQAGTAFASRIASFDGTSWSEVGGGLGGGISASVSALYSFNNLLYAGGAFTQAGLVTTNSIAQWDGNSWAATDGGLASGSEVYAIHSYNDALVVGGSISATSRGISKGWAVLGCQSSCYANCDGSTGSPALTANDFQCFLNRFAANDPYANCDNSTGSPLLTANDFQCFLNKFAAGCS